LWSARTSSQWGDTFNFVALALLIYDLTGSGLGVSGVVVAEILPVLLLAPFAGSLVDRWPRVRVMVGSDLSRSALAIVLVVWHDAPVGVYAVAFGMSVGAVFFNPAASSVLPALVKKDALVAANSVSRANTPGVGRPVRMIMRLAGTRGSVPRGPAVDGPARPGRSPDPGHGWAGVVRALDVAGDH